MPVYLDERGEPMQQAPVYLDESGNPVASEEPRASPGRQSLFTDPRLDPAAAEDLTDEEVAGAESAKAAGLAGVAAQTATGPVGRFLSTPIGLGVTTAGESMLEGDSPRRAIAKGAIVAGGGGLLSRIMRSAAVSRAAAPVMDEAAAVAAPVVERAYRGIPSLMKVVAPAEEAVTAASAAERAAGAKSILKTIAQKAAPAAEKAAKPAAKAATPVAEEAAGALEREIEAKVIRLKTGIGKGLSADQLVESVEEIYKVPSKAARSIVKRVFKEQGY